MKFSDLARLKQSRCATNCLAPLRSSFNGHCARVCQPPLLAALSQPYSGLEEELCDISRSLLTVLDVSSGHYSSYSEITLALKLLSALTTADTAAAALLQAGALEVCAS